MKSFIFQLLFLTSSVAFADFYSCGANTNTKTARSNVVYCDCSGSHGDITASQDGTCPSSCVPRMANDSQEACSIARDMAMLGSDELQCPRTCPTEVDQSSKDPDRRTNSCKFTYNVLCDE